MKSKFISSWSYIAILTPLLLFTFFEFVCCKNVDNIYNPYVFQYNEDVTVNTLDPAYIKSQSEIWIASQIYEGLVGLDSLQNPVPALSKHWEISKNGCVYKFVINTNARFAHTNAQKWGATAIQYQRLTAFDVVYSFYRVINPATASPGAWIFSDKVQIPKKFDFNHLEKSMMLDSAPFKAPNDSTVIIQLKSPFPAFLSILATNYAWVIPASTRNFEPGKLGRNPIGTGPFFLKRWEEDVRLVMLKNPQYHEFEGLARLPYLHAINVDFVKNKQTAFMQFVAKKYDFFNGIDGSFKDDLLNKNGTLNSKYDHKIKALITPFLNTEYIGFYLGDSLNGKKNPFTDKYLRKAMQWSIDRKSLVKYLRNGLGAEGNGGFVPPALFDGLTKKKNNLKYDLNIAKMHLQKSKVLLNKNQYAPLKLTVTADYLDMAVFLQQSWKQIGLSVEIDLQTGGMLRQLRNQGKLGMFRGSWIADYPDAENYLSCFYSKYFSPNGPNYTHFQSLKFDQIFEKIAFGTYANREDRNLDCIAADQILDDEVPILILYYDKSLRLHHPHVINLKNDASNRLELKRVRKKIKNSL